MTLNKTMKYMGLVAGAVSALTLAGCTEDVSAQLQFPAMPPELADCRVFWVSSQQGYQMTVVRCPNSTTTTTVPSGKTTQTTVVIDGKAYVPAEGK